MLSLFFSRTPIVQNIVTCIAECDIACALSLTHAHKSRTFSNIASSHSLSLSHAHMSRILSSASRNDTSHSPSLSHTHTHVKNILKHNIVSSHSHTLSKHTHSVDELRHLSKHTHSVDELRHTSYVYCMSVYVIIQKQNNGIHTPTLFLINDIRHEHSQM